jgi:hypothetical protein
MEVILVVIALKANISEMVREEALAQMSQASFSVAKQGFNNAMACRSSILAIMRMEVALLLHHGFTAW